MSYPVQWKVIRTLASGGMGEVYLVETPEGHPVVVKAFPQGFAGRSTLEHEVRFLSRLDHPLLVPIRGASSETREILGEDRGPCYWMDYVEGKEILDASSGAEPARIWRWFHEAVETLAFLHRQGVLHGDLSPRNILIDTNGLPRLLDFGLSSLLPQSSSLLFPLSGTFPYLAPERIDGLNLPASDLFSLGTVFYEALAKVHPRAACKNLADVIRREVKPLSEAISALPAEFILPSRVIDRMIVADPSQRFAQAEEVLQALGEGLEMATPRARPFHAVVMMGAEGHFAAVEAALKESAKRSTIFCVHGLSGVGKSRFLREVGFQCALSGIRPLVHPSLETWSPTDLAQLLRLREGGLPEKGAMVFLEWNDDLLSPRSREFLTTILKWPGVQEIPLKALNREETTEMIRMGLGAEATPEVIEPLFEMTGGSPRMLAPLITDLREARSGPAPRTLEAWLREVRPLRSFRDFIVGRLKGLEEDSRQILLILATAGEPVAPEALYSVWNGEETTLRRRLEDLRERELIAMGDNGFYFVASPILKEAVLSEAAPEDQRRAHEAWATHLSEAPFPHAQRLRHAIALKSRPDVTEGLRPTLESIRNSGRHQQALDLLSAGLPLVADASERSRLLRLKVNLLNDLDRYEEALKVCEEWRRLNAPDEPEEFRLFKYWFITGLAYRNLGRNGEAARRFERCLEASKTFKEDPTGFRIRAHTLLGRITLEEGRIDTAKERLQTALNLSEPQGRERAEVLRQMAVVAAEEGRWEKAKDYFVKAVKCYQDNRFEEGLFSTHLQEGLLALSHQDLDQAESSLAEAEAMAGRANDPFWRAAVGTNRAILERIRGRLLQALDLLSRSHEILKSLGDPKDLAENLRQQALTEGAVGRFDRAMKKVEELAALVPQYPGAKAILHDVRKKVSDFQKGITTETKESLERLYQSLPPALQVSFVDRGDYRKWFGSEPRPTQIPSERDDLMQAKPLFDGLFELNDVLLREDDMDRVLRHLMETAMELAMAENGFLLVGNESAKEPPLPGYSVAVARNIKKRDLGGEAWGFSLSAVKEALRTGEPVVTDNALRDRRFREAKSVHARQLKSILALPVLGPEGILGVFYLDHRLEQGLFGEEILPAMKAFAGTAALALQKGRMIEDLKRSNTDLSVQVEKKASEAVLMERELRQSRRILKNEYKEIIGRSPKMMEVLSLVDRITESRIPVWIYGESGTGKEAIARSLHFNSARAPHPFVTENCSALPETLLESELFGHKKGAFTHATQDKKGLLEYADKGTIFLDEIADMSLALQAKLLRFLQEGEIRPIGSHQIVKVEVRVVSASNKDLPRLVREGKFREDLFFRLNGVTVTLPPLRERLEDLSLLASHFLKKISEREKKPACRLANEAMKVFLQYPWPGNVRELQNTLETAVLFAEKGVVLPSSLHFKPALVGKSSAVSQPASEETPEKIPEELVKILRALRDHCFHRGEAAKALGMSRQHLYRKLERFGVSRDLETLKGYIQRCFGETS